MPTLKCDLAQPLKADFLDWIQGDTPTVRCTTNVNGVATNADSLGFLTAILYTNRGNVVGALTGNPWVDFSLPDTITGAIGQTDYFIRLEDTSSGKFQHLARGKMAFLDGIGTVTSDQIPANPYYAVPSNDFLAASGAALRGSSEDSITIDPGPINLNIGAGRAFVLQDYVSIVSGGAPANRMAGTLTAYNAITGDATVDVTKTNGGGTYDDWIVRVTGEQGETGPQGPQGDQGIQGVQGPQGDPGADGDAVTWVVANGVPSDATDGENGDMALDKLTGDVYGPKVDGAWGAIQGNIQGPQGGAGSDGADGESPQWIVTAGAPDDGTDGEDGWMCLDGTSGDVYGPKTAGAWGGPVANIEGPQGPIGADGADGQDGVVDVAGRPAKALLFVNAAVTSVNSDADLTFDAGTSPKKLTVKGTMQVERTGVAAETLLVQLDSVRQALIFTCQESGKKPLRIRRFHDNSGGAAGSMDIIFETGIAASPLEVMRITESGTLQCKGPGGSAFVLANKYTPSSSSDSGPPVGSVWADDNYLYYKPVAGTIKRVEWQEF